MAPVLDVRNLVKRYRNGTVANAGISLAIEAGEIYGLLGPNGAGKTTLVGQVLGLLRPTSGMIYVDGVDVVADPGYARRVIGLLPQSQVGMEAIHVDELIYSIGKLRGLDRAAARTRTEELIDRLRLGEFRHTQMRSTSGGVRRLAGFAAAVIAESRILVLDEPTNDVDPVRRQVLWEVVDELGQRGTTILLVTHNLAESERFIDRLAIIDRGRILSEGSPTSLRTLVTHRLRLELTTVNGFMPHPALSPEPGAEKNYLFDRADLAVVSEWLSQLQREGEVLDFRIGPPTLEDIYTAAVNGRREVVA